MRNVAKLKVYHDFVWDTAIGRRTALNLLKEVPRVASSMKRSKHVLMVLQDQRIKEPMVIYKLN